MCRGADAWSGCFGQQAGRCRSWDRCLLQIAGDGGLADARVDIEDQAEPVVFFANSCHSAST